MWFGERKCSGWYNLYSYRRQWLKWTYQTRWAPYGLPGTCEHMASGHNKRPGKVCGDCQEFFPSPCRNNEADHQGLDTLLTVMPGSRRLWNTKQSLGEVSSNHQAMACPLLSLRTLELKRKHLHTAENRNKNPTHLWEQRAKAELRTREAEAVPKTHMLQHYKVTGSPQQGLPPCPHHSVSLKTTDFR